MSTNFAIIGGDLRSVKLLKILGRLIVYMRLNVKNKEVYK